MARTMDRPIPLVPPVTIATLLESELFFSPFSRLRGRFCRFQAWTACH
jgi:hypothetical protein